MVGGCSCFLYVWNSHKNLSYGLRRLSSASILTMTQIYVGKFTERHNCNEEGQNYDAKSDRVYI